MPPVDCCDPADRLLTLTEALALALPTLPPIEATETVALLDAFGRVLAKDVMARLDTPPGDQSAMDGFALHLADLLPGDSTRLPVVAQALAGHPCPGLLPCGVAARITTGALVPDGPNTVIMQEHCRIGPNEAWIDIQPEQAARLKSGANIRRRGEDVQAGTLLLSKGLRLRPQDVALAAGQGIAALEVVRRPRVAVVSTGDELQEPGAQLPAGAIYESNRYTLIGLLQALGCAVSDLGILRDQREALLAALREAATDHDVLLTSGGVSVGTADWVREVIAELGQIQFWRLAVKPGKPVMLGRIGNCRVLGLPGNPVSVMVSFLMFAQPLLLRLMGASPAEPVRWPVVADFTFQRKAGRREWLRARLHPDAEGGLRVRIYHTDSSGALSSVSWADGLVELPEACSRIVPGDVVDYLPFTGLGVH